MLIIFAKMGIFFKNSRISWAKGSSSAVKVGHRFCGSGTGVGCWVRNRESVRVGSISVGFGFRAVRVSMDGDVYRVEAAVIAEEAVVAGATVVVMVVVMVSQP